MPDIEEKFSDYLEIQTTKLDYKLSTDFYNYYGILTAKLRNTTQDTFYSNIGDGFIGSMDQEVLILAYKTDGFFEFENISETWESVEQGRLFEGSKVIRILPGKEYELQASALIDSNNIGKYRLRLNYYREYLEEVKDTLRDTSNSFYIYK